jgi:hypothetical protein
MIGHVWMWPAAAIQSTSLKKTNRQAFRFAISHEDSAAGLALRDAFSSLSLARFALGPAITPSGNSGPVRATAWIYPSRIRSIADIPAASEGKVQVNGALVEASISAQNRKYQHRN